MVDYRVLVDWDGDGYINRGVSSDTPPNLWPNALYQNGSQTHGIQYTTEAEVFEDITDITDYGYVTRRVKFGKDGEGDYAESLRLGFAGYDDWQPQPGDQPNGFEGSHSFSFYKDFPVGSAAPHNVDYNVPSRNNIVIVEPEGDKSLVGKRVFRSNYQSGTTPHLVVGAAMSASTRPNVLYYQSNNYYDASFQYSRALTSGAGLTALINPMKGKVYNTNMTFVCRVRSNQAQTMRLRLYEGYGSSATPNFGRTYVGGVDFVYTAGMIGTWQTLTVNYTAATDSLIADLQLAMSTGGYSEWGGFMMFDTTRTAPSRFWDNIITFNKDQFAGILEADQDYTFSFYVRSTDGITDASGTAYTHGLSTNTTENEGAVSVTDIGLDWKRVNVYFPARAYRRGFSVDLPTIMKGVNPVGLDEVGSLDITGYMLCEGSTLWPYHAGESYGYDDLGVNSLNLSVKTKSGKGKFEEALPYEGTMEVQLDNSTRLFSPSNEDSPLYGMLTQNKKIVLEVRDSITSEWTPLWTGWTFQYAVIPGSLEPKITLTAQQGMFRLREGTFSTAPTADTTMDAMARQIIESSGWKSAASPFRSTVGYNTRLDENAYIADVDFFYEEVQPGVNSLELAGQDWGSDTEPEAALKEVLLSENASMWITREGKIKIVNRNHWVTNVTATEVLIDIDVQDADYTYGNEVINRAAVTINRKKVETDQPIWKSHRAIRILGNGGTTIEINPQYTEGRKRSVVEYTTEGMDKTIYKADPGPYYLNPVTASTEESDKVVVELVPFGSGGVYRLRIKNNNAFQIWADIVLKGDFIETEDGEVVVAQDEVAIKASESINNLDLKTGILDSPLQAESMGGMYVQRSSYPSGEFNSILVREDIEFALAVTIGSTLDLTEQQTDEEDLRHVVIGEEISLSSNTFEITYKLARGFTRDYYIVGTSKLGSISVAAGSTDNIISDMGYVKTYFGGTAEVIPWADEGFDTIVEYKTGLGQNKLYLSPAEDQIVEYSLAQNATGYFGDGAYSLRGTANDTYLIEGEWSKSPSSVGVKPSSYVSDLYCHQVQVATGFVTNKWLGFFRTAGGDAKLGLKDATQYDLLSYHPWSAPGSYNIFAAGQVADPGTLTEWGDDAGGNFQRLAFTTDYQFLPGEPDYFNQWVGQGSRTKQVGFIIPQDGINGPTYTLSPVALIQKTRVLKSIHSGDVAYKYTVYARVRNGSNPSNWKLSVQVYRGRNVTIENTYTQTKFVGFDLVKFEVTIPVNPYSFGQIQSVYATLERTDAISREDTLLVYAYGLTRASVAEPTDLIRSDTPTILYP